MNSPSPHTVFVLNGDTETICTGCLETFVLTPDVGLSPEMWKHAEDVHGSISAQLLQTDLNSDVWNTESESNPVETPSPSTVVIRQKMMHVRHPKDEEFDAIDIRVVPRWKESELSGDEWRFSYEAQVKRKGETIITITAGRLDWLLKRLQGDILTACEEENVDHEAWERTETKCDQLGCAEIATVFYVCHNRYTERGDMLAPNEFHDGNEYRQYCERHKNRGDCALDDAMHNYGLISNPRKKTDDV